MLLLLLSLCFLHETLLEELEFVNDSASLIGLSKDLVHVATPLLVYQIDQVDPALHRHFRGLETSEVRL